MASKRPAKLELVHKDSREKLEFGGVFPSKFAGAFSVSLTLPTGETDANGYPVREKITDVKTESGRTVKLSDYFVNLTVFEALAAREPRNY